MKYVVVGGGIAGVSCAKQLLESFRRTDHVTLISASKVVKVVSHWRQIGRFCETFDVEEGEMVSKYTRFRFIEAKVCHWNYKDKELLLSDGSDPVKYDKLCIATGAQPIVPFSSKKVLTIRDTESADVLQRRLHGAKHVAVVGNGGIATEVVFEMRKISITWIIRDDSISSVFFDSAVSGFFQKHLEMGRTEGEKNSGILKRLRYSLSGSKKVDTMQDLPGCALGPDWMSPLSFDCNSQERSVNVIRNVEVQEVIDEEDGVILSLSSGKQIRCDFVIWATGVVPMANVWKDSCKELRISASDGGILVNDSMRTSVPDVYACGDVCTTSFSNPSCFWKQMRLWTQARQMGEYCARSMLASGTLDVDICFELFAHTTSFFGYKVVFLGDFKGERQPEGWYPIDRITEDDEFVRCIMYNHRVVGAILIGETDLEETMENLILNETNLEAIEEDFLDPNINMEDFFD